MAPKVKSGGIKKTTKFKKVTQKRLSSKAPLSSGETSTTPPQDANPNSAIYFWRPHTPNGYLSQWYESPFEHDGCTYETAEKWMMVGKARLFGDTEIAQRMLETTDPKEHKRLGRLVKNFDDRVWNTERMRIVEEGTWWKFTESNDKEELKRLLLETGERELVEVGLEWDSWRQCVVG